MADLGVTESQPGAHTRLSIVPLVAWLAVIALLALFVYGLSTQRLTAGIMPKPNTVAPNFKLTTFDGKPMNLADYRGKVVVVNFWASWCQPCKDEQSDLVTLAKRFQGQNVAFLGIDIQDNQHDALAYLQQYGVTYPVAADPTGAVYIDYGVVGMPETYVVNRQGMISQKIVGPIDPNGLTATIEEQLR